MKYPDSPRSPQAPTAASHKESRSIQRLPQQLTTDVLQLIIARWARRTQLAVRENHAIILDDKSMPPVARRFRFQRAVMRNDLIPVKGHFRTEKSSLALYWCLFPARSRALMTQLFTLFWLLMHSNSSYLISPPQTAEGFLIHFTTLHPFRADPCLILSQTPRWARLTYDSVHFGNTAALSSGVHLLFGTSESFILKSADVWLVCHRCHKQHLLVFFWGGGSSHHIQENYSFDKQKLALCASVRSSGGAAGITGLKWTLLPS